MVSTMGLVRIRKYEGGITNYEMGNWNYEFGITNYEVSSRLPIPDGFNHG
jgi:hypothetical protein